MISLISLTPLTTISLNLFRALTTFNIIPSEVFKDGERCDGEVTLVRAVLKDNDKAFYYTVAQVSPPQDSTLSFFPALPLLTGHAN